jgi:hypothetical protein
MHSNYLVKDHTLALLVAAKFPCSCCSCSRLPTATNSPVPPSQTLGVLFFPLSPPSRKGATHNQKILAPQLASKAELPLTNAEASQLLPVNQSVLPLCSRSPISAKTPKAKKSKKKPLLFLSFFLLTPQNPNPPLTFPPFLLASFV